MLKEHRLSFQTRRDIARFLYAAGVKPKYSTDIADCLTAGYGKLDKYGFWEYELCAE